MSFQGATDLDYITLGQPAILNLLPQGTQYTLSVWFKTLTNVDYGTFFCRGDSATKQFHFSIGSPGPPYELQAQIGGTFYTTGVDVGDGLWHHGVLTNANVAGTYRFQMYNNGVAAGNLTASGASTIACDVLIGARRATGNTGAGFVMRGSLADARIYNRVLSLPEIQTLYYSRGRDNLVTGLIGRWLMNESAPGVTCTGTATVKDSSSQRNDGTPSATPIYVDDEPLTLKRKFFV
jgi:hypothetical protein